MKRWLSANAPLLRALLQHLDTPKSLAVWLAIEAGEWDYLALQWVDPAHYPEGIFNALRYRRDVQAVDLLRKAPLPTRIDRRAAAMKAWHDAETHCYHTNEFIGSLFPVGIPKDPHAGRLAQYLHAVQKRMARWLGPLPDELEGGFGPGTCVESKDCNPTVVDKIWLTPTTTPSASHLFTWHYDRTLWGALRWAGRLGCPGTSRGNRLTTVPKDGKTDRPISIEPLGNLWLQLGIGRHLKRRLRAIGLPAYKPDSRELFPGYRYAERDAQSIHREFLYRCGPERFSTIDLSSASDTVAYELVRAVIPPDWFQLLDDTRSKYTWVPSQGGGGRWHKLEKFSSMGNGFTFELESLIFASLLSVAFGLTPGRDLLVFGDDIILPERYFDSACTLLSTFGFIPNLRKSFKTPPFFESCGGNVHSGIDVTPVRIKGPLDEPTELYAFHNACYRWGFNRASLRRIRDLIPRRLQFAGPEQLGDVVLHGLPYTPTRFNGCVWVKVLSSRPKVSIPLERWNTDLAVVALLLGSSTQVVRRGSPMKHFGGLASIS